MKLSTSYRPDIDGLRAIAVISVMLYHLNGAWLPGGFTGVDVFFVISGFVVTSSLAQSSAINAWQFITQFYARRLARIIPALLFVLLTTIICATLFIPQAWLSQFSEETARFAFFGLSNIKLQNNVDTYFAPRTEYNPYTHTWSLGVEEQFYLIVPVLIYFWLKATRKQHHRAIAQIQTLLGLLTLTSFLWCIWATSHLPTMAFYSISTRFWELAAGAGLFIATCHQHQTRRTPHLMPHLFGMNTLGSPALTAGAGLILIGLGFIFANGTQFPWPWALLPVLGTVLLIGGAHLQPNDCIRSWLSSAAAVWIGKRSYSLYLWHWPIYVLLRWTMGLDQTWQYAIALILTILLSMFSYRFIEQPLRHNRFLEKRPDIVVIVIFLSFTAGIYKLSNDLFRHASRYSLSTVMQHEQDWYRNGLSTFPNMVPYECQPEREMGPISGGHYIALKPKEDCPSDAPTAAANPSKQIFVLGDSHADALFPALEELSAQHQIPVFLYAYPGCSFIDFRAPMQQGFGADCNVFNREVSVQVLKQAKPGDLVLLPSLRMRRYTDQWTNFGITSMREQMYNEKANKARAAATNDAKQWIAPFINARLNVVFVAPPPIFKSPTFRCVDWFNQHNPICAGGLEIPKSEMVLLRTPVLEQMQTLSQQLPRVWIWDPFDALCPGDQCTAVLEGRPLFFDGDHLSNYANWLLYPSLNDWLTNHQLLAH